MQFYYDTHCHILPGVDDGAADMEETRRMLLIAYEEGIRVIVATPHYISGENNKTAENLKSTMEEVNRLAVGVNSDFRVVLGNELFYNTDLFEDLKNGSALTINNTRYILLEFDINEAYKTIRKGLLQCLFEGYLPILAHTERYQCLMNNLERVEELVHLGTYIQLNYSSLIGSRINPRFILSRKLLKHNLVHFLGSDAHNAGVRPPHAKEAVEYIKRRYGEEITEQLVWLNPMTMLKDKPI